MKQIKSLTVFNRQQIIYQINFLTNQQTGTNKLSKKTLFALVDFCLGGNWNQNLFRQRHWKVIVNNINHLRIKLVIVPFKSKKTKQIIIERSVDNNDLKINHQDFSQKSDPLKAFSNALEQNLSDHDPLTTLKTNLKWQINQPKADLWTQLRIYQHRVRIFNDEIADLELKKSLIEATINDLLNDQYHQDIETLKNIYEQATKIDFGKINKSFQDLINYHNQMIIEKIKFMNYNQDLELLEQEINQLKQSQAKLLKQVNHIKKQLSI